MPRKANSKRRPDATALLDRVATFYEKSLSQSPKGFEYLKAQGVADSSCLESLRVGYCDGSLTETLPENGQVPETLRSLGVLDSEGREIFADSVVFPVCDPEGAVTSLVGRRITDGTDLFLLDPPTGVWNLPACSHFSKILMTTNIMDGLCLQVAGYANVCAAFKSLTDADVGCLTDLGVQEILLVGPKRQLKALVRQLKGSNLATRFCHTPSISAILHKSGVQGVEALIESAEAAPVEEMPVSQSGSPGVEVLEHGFRTHFGKRRYEVRGLEKGGAQYEGDGAR